MDNSAKEELERRIELIYDLKEVYHKIEVMTLTTTIAYVYDKLTYILSNLDTILGNLEDY